jgi:secondary thiamine-phosphate synthase enzyme
VNENADADVGADILGALRRLAPRQAEWLHREENADAHVKAVLTGASVTLPVVDGKLALGIWQGIFLCEFDGPRRRHLMVTGIG